jgi:coproporphyrinogen III oxidase
MARFPLNHEVTEPPIADSPEAILGNTAERLQGHVSPDYAPLVASGDSKLRNYFQSVFREVQSCYCEALEQFEPECRFSRDQWVREKEQVITEGHGTTRVLSGGTVFEHAVVALSSVRGLLPPAMSDKLIGSPHETPFSADGVSVIVHPLSPMIPTTHANVRLLTVGDKTWFGGGADLTPYYLFEDDAQLFHQRLYDICETTRSGWYQSLRQWCDEYFYLPHRREARGIGGIFYDYVGRDSLEDLLDGARLTELLGRGLAGCYIPIVEKRKGIPWGDSERLFQEIRRGRYVEFNLLHDRGTQFGLQTGGRTESILASLPPRAQWSYGYEPQVGSREASLIEALRNPRDWLKGAQIS